MFLHFSDKQMTATYRWRFAIFVRIIYVILLLYYIIQSKRVILLLPSSFFFCSQNIYYLHVYCIMYSIFLTSELIFTEVPTPGAHPRGLQSFTRKFFLFFSFHKYSHSRYTCVFLVSNGNEMRLLLRLFSFENIIPRNL